MSGRIAAGRTLGERAETRAAAVLAHLPPAVKRRLAGPPIVRDGLELDLDTQLVLRIMERQGRQGVTTTSPEASRRDLRRQTRVGAGPPTPMAEVRELEVAGGEGPLAARLYVPPEVASVPAAPLLVYFHGGGWTIGDLDTHEPPCRLLAVSGGARVLAVDYRLAPEHRFPAAVDDALAAFRDAAGRADELGADPQRIAVGGDSAGGMLSAVVAQQAAAEGGPAPALQLLIYPATDFAGRTRSRELFAEGFALTEESMDFFEGHFLTAADDRLDPRLSPLRAEDLSGLAPAIVVTAGFDPLRDEGEAYAGRLREAGVPVVLRRHSGFMHGFLHLLAIGRGPREAIAEMGGAVRAALSLAEVPAGRSLNT